MHSSLAARIAIAQSYPAMLIRLLKPIGGNPAPDLGLSTAKCLQLLDWNARTLAPDKCGLIAQAVPALVSIVDRNPACWTSRVGACGNGCTPAAGSTQNLIALGQRVGQRWLKGVRLAANLG